MESLQMQWVECPLLDAAGVVLHPPSGSDDDDDGDDPIDLLNRREGHCSAVVYPVTSIDVPAASSRESWVLVCGGYSNGSVSATPLVARTTLLPALQWVRLPPVDALECDGATLTTVGSAVGVEAMPTTASASSALSGVCTTAAPAAYLFGGLDADMNRRNTLYAVTLHIDADATPVMVQVAEVQCTGTPPEARVRHGAGGHAGCLYIFGGETDTQEQSSDLYVCDVQAGVWRVLASPSPLLSPAPRLLSLSLLFMTPTMFVLYGGAHFVNGDLRSFADVWSFDLATETWSVVVPPEADDSTPGSEWRADAPQRVLPPSNGHAGCVFALRPSGSATYVCAAFLGGKNTSEGDDAVKLVCFRPQTKTIEVCARSATPVAVSRKLPHWRYTPAVVSTEKGLLLLAGQCRHPQTPSAFLLTVSIGGVGGE
ncbi:conserved hypothetical protein [Leishmania braziliensis MHOM/BR/75/M2904]|uniref:Uncharacterized protein n=2 Tax=Leishmania braziliensis TaxID=5660 RepID=A4HGL2_LEIBR|nr:conserved hypothetical protein [Leishmania braziliensis MHOM/BR/75/M2904]CAJ2475899.1 unnamed protein product [Leishmania braziliensis]CAJ2476359.1 unnamed protein product [Leishmania braziliensis]CAM39706.1 conserved hypothetical protein [Leishmania braziliensis MHOM/BR/75/M2904]SYZ67358.1 Kelch_motif/Galactose_oxidase [Leishmania braziliensis MHOM/BR/75/M2904]